MVIIDYTKLGTLIHRAYCLIFTYIVSARSRLPASSSFSLSASPSPINFIILVPNTEGKVTEELKVLEPLPYDSEGEKKKLDGEIGKVRRRLGEVEKYMKRGIVYWHGHFTYPSVFVKSGRSKNVQSD